MANFQAYNDKIWTLPLKCVNVATGLTQAFPNGSALAAVSSLPNSLAASINFAGNLVLTPKVQNSPGITITVTGNALTSAMIVVDVITDPNQLAIIIDTADSDVTTTSQAVPVAPGP